MNTVKFWAAFGIAIAAGAAVALVFAPQTGADTREQLKRKFDDATDYLKEVGGDFSNRAGDAVNHGKDVVDDLVNSASRARNIAAERVADFTS